MQRRIAAHGSAHSSNQSAADCLVQTLHDVRSHLREIVGLFSCNPQSMNPQLMRFYTDETRKGTPRYILAEKKCNTKRFHSLIKGNETSVGIIEIEAMIAQKNHGR
jgi:hypothetical protein